MKKYTSPLLTLILFGFITTGSTNVFGTGIIVGHQHANLSSIPLKWINKVKSNLHIAYNHTSHGSQIVTGLTALANYPDFKDTYQWTPKKHYNENELSLYDRILGTPPDLSQGDRDTDKDGIADWAERTYSFLTEDKDGDEQIDNLHINVVMWSWCNIAGHNIPRYIDSMEWLIKQFGPNGSNHRSKDHPVHFIFMTAHANGGGENDSSDQANNQIRNHCKNNNRILFDFADIENYDPDGNYYLDKNLKDNLDYNSGGKNHNWASDFLKQHNNSDLFFLVKGKDSYEGCGNCAHSGGKRDSSTLNCILKGNAAWWLFARLAGWDGKI